MKLRFTVDEALHARMRVALDAAAPKPPSGRRLSCVYLDTAEDDLATRGVALRFRRSLTLSAGAGAPTLAPSWKRQMLWPAGGPTNLKVLGLARLRQRLDATFTTRIERWTWQPNDWSEVSLDRIALSTGRSFEEALEMHIRCRRRRRADAMEMALALGAGQPVSRSVRERGRALLLDERRTASPA